MPDDVKQALSSQPFALPAAPTLDEQATTKAYVDALAAQKVNKAGDTMTGELLLNGTPVTDAAAVPKSYVDGLLNRTASDIESDPLVAHGDCQVVATNIQDALEQLDDQKVTKCGDTMTGALILRNADPVTTTEATPKYYVDKMGSLEFSFTSQTHIEQVHTLNRRPKVTVYDTAGVEYFATVTYNNSSPNVVTVDFKVPFSGKLLLT